MKDATLYILSELYRILSGANLGVPVYNIEQFPGEKEDLFVRVASSFDMPGRTKDKFTQELHVNVDVVNRMAGDLLSEQPAAELVNLVMNAIIPGVNSSVFAAHPDFKIYDAIYANGTTITERDNVGVIYIRQLEFQFNIAIK